VSPKSYFSVFKLQFTFRAEGEPLFTKLKLWLEAMWPIAICWALAT